MFRLGNNSNNIDTSSIHYVQRLDGTVKHFDQSTGIILANHCDTKRMIDSNPEIISKDFSVQ